MDLHYNISPVDSVSLPSFPVVSAAQAYLLGMSHMCFSWFSWFTAVTFLHSSPVPLLPRESPLCRILSLECQGRASVICGHWLFLTCWERAFASCPPSPDSSSLSSWELPIKGCFSWVGNHGVSRVILTKFFFFLPQCSHRTSDQTICTETSTFK